MLHQSTMVFVIAIAMISVMGSAQMMMPPVQPPYYNDMMSNPPVQSPPSSTPAPAPAPGVDCFTQLLNLSDCLTYVESGSNLTKPDKPCCPELAGLVESNPICLCQLLTVNASSYGFDIDKKRAFGLPSVCSVSTPPVSLCSLINGSPAGAPSPSQVGGGGGGGSSIAAGPGGAMSPSPASSGDSSGPSSHSSPTANHPNQLFTTAIIIIISTSSLLLMATQ
ncbi:Non-specific lipid transfer protein GPI-anchored 2 [Linum perenne]